MKNIFLALLISFSNTYIIQAQCYDLYIKTPNKSNVKACYGGGYV